MLAAWMIIAQVASAPPLEIDFDLKTVKPADCAGAAGEIVVCARRQRDLRLAPLPPTLDALPRADVRLPGGATGQVRLDKKVFPGAVSNRVMAGVRLPF